MDKDTSIKTIPTERAAKLLGLNRPQFQVLVRLLNLRPSGQKKLSTYARTPGFLFDPADIKLLRKLMESCRCKGFKATLKPLVENHVARRSCIHLVAGDDLRVQGTKRSTHPLTEIVL